MWIFMFSLLEWGSLTTRERTMHPEMLQTEGHKLTLEKVQQVGLKHARSKP
jgi:hypothetical protein